MTEVSFVLEALYSKEGKAGERRCQVMKNLVCRLFPRSGSVQHNFIYSTYFLILNYCKHCSSSSFLVSFQNFLSRDLEAYTEYKKFIWFRAGRRFFL